MTIVVTMAGEGRRFREAGYDMPKFRIEVRGRSLFSWAMESLRDFFAAGQPAVFVAREDDDAAEFIARECGALGISDYALVGLRGMTDGQATTALMAADAVSDRATPFLIYNIDTYVEPSALPASALRGDGWIPCFGAEGEGWSFVRLDSSGRAVEVREKKRISPHATIGLYGFASFDLYESAYHAYYADPSRLERGETYVAPLYNQLIGDGHEVRILEVPVAAVHPLGTPEEVEAFAGAR